MSTVRDTIGDTCLMHRIVVWQGPSFVRIRWVDNTIVAVVDNKSEGREEDT